jgi:hypothetical protein
MLKWCVATSSVTEAEVAPAILLHDFTKLLDLLKSEQPAA